MKRLFAGLSLLAAVIGAPTALVAATGPPSIPGPFGELSGSYLPLEPVLEFLALVGWALWACLAVAAAARVVAVTIARRTGRDDLVRATDRIAPPVMRRLVDLAVGGAFLAASLSVARAPESPPTAAAQVVLADAAPAPDTAVSVARQPQITTYTVRSGDSLWRIAERRLGTGFRWKEIFDLNRGRVFPDGRCLENPRLIHPGWDLRLPTPNGEVKHGPSVRAEDRSTKTRSAISPTLGPGETPAEVNTPSPSLDSIDDGSSSSSVDPREAQEVARPVVSLPSGAVIAASFACGVLSAEMLTRLRRRRARRPLSDDGAIEMPERLVRDLRHAGAAPSVGPIGVAVDEVIASWRAHAGSPPRLLAAVEGRRRIEVLLDGQAGRPLPKPSGGRVSPEIRFEHSAGGVRAAVRGPFPPRLRRASTPMQRGLLVPVGHAPGKAVHVAPLGVGVVSITGEESADVVRQVLLAEAADAAPDELQIIVLGTPDLPMGRLPHVTGRADWNDASAVLQAIQAEFIQRARLFEREGVADIWEHLAARSDEHLPGVIIVAGDPPASMRGLLDAIAHETRRYGGALLAVGWQPATTALHIAADGKGLVLETDLSLPRRLAPFTLDESTAQQVEEVICHATIEEPDTSSGEVAAPPARILTLEEPEEARPVRITAPTQSDRSQTTPPPGMPAVHCLGSFEVTRDGRARPKGWRAKARELLAYLIAHPDGVPKERIMDELWPGEDDLDRLQMLFEKAVSVVRVQVRGQNEAREYILKYEDAWRLERGAWWSDAFEFDRLIHQAERSGDVAESTSKLREAVALYRGNFCADLAYPWAEPVRERYRSAFTRACARLAENLAELGGNAEALAVLDKAIEADVLCEDLWRRAMTIESTMGRGRAAAERYNRLRQLLATELNVDPDPETQRLALEVMAAGQDLDERERASIDVR